MTPFEKALCAAGAEILSPTNPYEVMRFKTSHGVGVVYRNKRGGETWNEQAIAARDHIKNGLGSLSPVKTVGRKALGGLVEKILKRDGGDCFFCARPLGNDITKEHLVPIAHGGPNHISNIFLAHSQCNMDAGHMSAPEKIEKRVKSRIELEICRAQGA